jgi:hypothetical protein
MGNVVVNTIVRMFSRKAVGKAMKSAKKSMGAKKGKQDGDYKERPPRGRAPRTRRSSTRGPWVPEKEARARWAEEE